MITHCIYIHIYTYTHIDIYTYTNTHIQIHKYKYKYNERIQPLQYLKDFELIRPLTLTEQTFLTNCPFL